MPRGPLAVDVQAFAPEAPTFEPHAGPAPAWSPLKRLLFRFVFAYLVLYNLPFPLDELPGLEVIERWYQKLWNLIVPWTGSHVFRADTSVLPNGSGDTTYNYVQIFCFLVIAMVATAVWTLLDRRRSSYARLHEGLWIYLRFSLGAAMIAYGAFKVIKSQFPDPSLDRLLQPYGDSSPMGLLWTLMGASKPYNLFSGAVEMVGGLLLTVRRTALLGALVSLCAVANIVALNFCYDVPVKLYSSHLLVMAIVVIAPDAKRLLAVLLGRGAEPVATQPLFRRVWLERSTVVLRTLAVLALTAFVLKFSYGNAQTYAARFRAVPLRGIWNVEEIEVDGQPRPPVVTDSERWRRVIFDVSGVLAVQAMSDARTRYVLTLDKDKGSMVLGKRDDPQWKATFAYAQPQPDILALDGAMDGRKIRARLHLQETPKFLLTTRGFHWINERPFNR
jgi:hypothetical protein